MIAAYVYWQNTTIVGVKLKARLWEIIITNLEDTDLLELDHMKAPIH